MTDRETLTEQERAQLRLYTDRASKVLRIIDAHEADRAALVKERDEALRSAESLRTAAHVQDAEVARLTAALAALRLRANRVSPLVEALEAAEQKLAEAEREIRHRERKTAELVKKLAAAEQNFGMLTDANASITVALNAAEARCRELEKENLDLHAAGLRTTGHLQAAESEVAQLRERVAKAVRLLEGPGDGWRCVGRALEALRGPK